VSITFCIEALSPAEDEALHSEHAPELNVHNAGGWTLLAALGIEPDHYGTITPGDLLDRIDSATAAPIPENLSVDYVAARLPLLRDIATAAGRLGRQVVWG
jgi:hypothetical protein